MLYKRLVLPLAVSAAFSLGSMPATEPPPPSDTVRVPLRVATGTPLRLYITHRVWFRRNETVRARLLEPVWVFDRIVLPAGATVEGRVVKLDPAPKMIQIQSLLGGNFTPLKRAEVSFDTLTLSDGRSIRLDTENSLGLNTRYSPPKASRHQPKTRANSAPAKHNAFVRAAQQQAQAQIDARTRGLYGLVRGPNKREWVENFVLSKLPYQPQWYRSGTRFDAVLSRPLELGSAQIGASELANCGGAPPPDSVAQMRILNTVSSGDARVGEPIQGTLSQPLFTPAHNLLLPEGTRFDGRITLATPARTFHRDGKLRFAIESVQLPSSIGDVNVAAFTPNTGREEARADLAAVEADPAAVHVDPEGTARATESKSRLLRPVVAGLIATKSLDNDTGKQTASGTGDPNTAGRAVGGFSGFGLLGTALSRASRSVGPVLAFYGLGWSVYTNVVSRGLDVTFQKNTSMAIRFGPNPGAHE